MCYEPIKAGVLGFITCRLQEYGVHLPCWQCLQGAVADLQEVILLIRMGPCSTPFARGC